MILDNTEQVKTEYAIMAKGYDRKWGGYVQGTTTKILSRMQSKPDMKLLDVACGTGLLLEEMHRQLPEAILHGVDLSSDMLQKARTRLPASIELKQASSSQLPFDSGCFDVVVTSSAFQYFNDPLASIREMTRVLRPGGQLIIADWCRDYWFCKLAAWYLKRTRNYFRVIYSISELKKLLEQSGLQNITYDFHIVARYWGIMTFWSTKALV